MPEKILSSFKVSRISKFLDKQFIGNDIKINKICSIGNVLNNSISFINKKEQKIDQSKKSLIIAIDNYKIDRNSNCTFIFSSNPKLDFIKILNHFFLEENKKKISDSVIIGKNCKIRKNVFIGEHTVIKDNVIIEEGTVYAKSGTDPTAFFESAIARDRQWLVGNGEDNDGDGEIDGGNANIYFDERYQDEGLGSRAFEIPDGEEEIALT